MESHTVWAVYNTYSLKRCESIFVAFPLVLCKFLWNFCGSQKFHKNFCEFLFLEFYGGVGGLWRLFFSRRVPTSAWPLFSRKFARKFHEFCNARSTQRGHTWFGPRTNMFRKPKIVRAPDKHVSKTELETRFPLKETWFPLKETCFSLKETRHARQKQGVCGVYFALRGYPLLQNRIFMQFSPNFHEFSWCRFLDFSRKIRKKNVGVEKNKRHSSSKFVKKHFLADS